MRGATAAYHIGTTGRAWPLLWALLVCLALGLSLSGSASASVLEVQVDKTRLTPGDVFQFAVTVNGITGSMPHPVIENLENFEIVGGPNQSTSFSFELGKGMSGRGTISYYLRPFDVGKQQIGPVKIEINGQIHSAEAITIEVIDTGRGGQAPPGQQPQQQQGQPAPQQQQQAPPAEQAAQSADGGLVPNGQQDLFLTHTVSNTNPYLGEQVQYRWRFYLSRRARQALADFEPLFPKFSGFWSERLEARGEAVENYGNQPYYVHEFQFSLFPSSTGVVTIDQTVANLLYRVFHRNNNNPSEVRSQPGEILVTVRPLPSAGQPRGFGGAVGRYQFEAGIDRDRLKTGEALTYTLSVKGEGNLKSLPNFSFEDLDKIGFRVFEPEVNVVADRRRFPVAGNQTVKVILVPRKAGTYTIPPRSFSYFDPASSTYRTAQTPQFIVTVEQGEEQDQALIVRPEDVQRPNVVRQTGQDIHYLITEYRAAPPARRYLYHNKALQGSMLLPPLLLVGILLYTRRRDRLEGDVGYARKRMAGGQLRKRLREVEAALGAGEAQRFYAELSRSLLEFLADHMNRQAAGLTSAEVDRFLSANAKVSTELRAGIRTLLETCDQSRFGLAPGAGDTARLRKDYDAAVNCLTDLQKVLG